MSSRRRSSSSSSRRKRCPSPLKRSAKTSRCQGPPLKTLRDFILGVSPALYDYLPSKDYRHLINAYKLCKVIVESFADANARIRNKMGTAGSSADIDLSAVSQSTFDALLAEFDPALPAKVTAAKDSSNELRYDVLVGGVMKQKGHWDAFHAYKEFVVKHPAVISLL